MFYHSGRLPALTDTQRKRWWWLEGTRHMLRASAGEEQSQSFHYFPPCLHSTVLWKSFYPFLLKTSAAYCLHRHPTGDHAAEWHMHIPSLSWLWFDLRAGRCSRGVSWSPRVNVYLEDAAAAEWMWIEESLFIVESGALCPALTPPPLSVCSEQKK